MKQPRSAHTATLRDNGDVLILGGVPATAETETFESGPMRWRQGAGQTRTLGLHSATLFGASGELLVIAFLSEAEIYDARTETWRQAGPLLTPRFGFSATRLSSGKVMVVGGTATFDHSTMLATAELYDPITGSFTATGSLAEGRRWHAAALLRTGEVLVAGGVNRNGQPLDTAELYDPTTQTFRSAGRMIQAHGPPGSPVPAVVLASGNVLIPGHEPVKSQIYDASTNSWRAAAGMLEERYNFNAVVLLSGQVLVVGGSAGQEAMKSGELYDPETDVWSPAGLMAVARERAAMVLLQSGQVLVTGGNPRDSLAELYTPDGVNDPGQGEEASSGCDVTPGARHRGPGLWAALLLLLVVYWLRTVPLQRLRSAATEPTAKSRNDQTFPSARPMS